MGGVSPVLWENGHATILAGTADFEWGSALGINNSGQIIGFVSATGDIGASEPFLWSDGKLTMLPTLIPGYESGAAAINDSGIIVGSTTIPAGSQTTDVFDGLTTDAVIWVNGAIIDLNSLLPSNSGWHLINATGINDADQIVGNATSNLGNSPFILTLGGALNPNNVTSVLLASTAGALHNTLMVVDTVAAVQSNLDALAQSAAAGMLKSIAFSDNLLPMLSVSDAQFINDGILWGLISGNAIVSAPSESLPCFARIRLGPQLRPDGGRRCAIHNRHLSEPAASRTDGRRQRLVSGARHHAPPGGVDAGYRGL